MNGGVVIIQSAPGSGIQDEETALKTYNNIAEKLGLSTAKTFNR